MTISVTDLTQAINVVERIHKIELNHIHRFISQNENYVLAVFSRLVDETSIDERFKLINNQLPSLHDDTGYLLEASFALC